MSSKWSMSKKELDFIHYKYGDTDEKIRDFLNQKERTDALDQFDIRVNEWLDNDKPMKVVDTETGYDPNECFGIGFNSKDKENCALCSIREACKEAHAFFVESTEKEIFHMSKLELSQEEEIEDDEILKRIEERVTGGIEKSNSGVKINTYPKMLIRSFTRDLEGRITVYSSRGLLPYINRWVETKKTCKEYKETRISFKIVLSDLVDFIDNMVFDTELEKK